MEFKPIGFKYCYFKNFDETIQIERPKNCGHNLVMGTLYIDVSGQMILKILKNKEMAKISFTGNGIF